MSEKELGQILKEMYERKGAKKSTMIHLFGIIYAKEIRRAGITPRAICKEADMPESYQVEINKGIALAQYVELKPNYVGDFNGK
ncbi:hypothetical protein O1N65_002358 [Listeria monocytogenes]|uniref:HTH-like domain-containing protein n=2 Tax=Listeria monocytogenes TaxID=1639 RepID=A0A458PME3_LISMN|nr:MULTISPECIES: hypothetical protein [Bacilli]EAE3706349.1 hypothetical protein [Listeria monocytogenes serotype 1/2b]ANE39614.1 hypothetical protein AAV53_10490 [Listeria monocytogenes]AQP80025.1 hypothetical protein B0X21_09615 [Listeria monocytogenes]EAC2470302.1 hypothetical protein [Listeria monocytogenes]EAC2470512.1 hypothetical protein [Listeria monocytogenes]